MLKSFDAPVFPEQYLPMLFLYLNEINMTKIGEKSVGTRELNSQSCVNNKRSSSYLDSSRKQWSIGANWRIIGPKDA